MKSPIVFIMTLILMCSCIADCSLRSAVAHEAVHGLVSTPIATKTVDGGVQDLIAQKADATAHGNKKLAHSLKIALFDENTASIDSNMRWFMSLGIIIIAIGAGIVYFGATKLGGTVAVIGGSLIALALTLTAILPYLMYLMLAGLVIAIGAVFWFLHTHRHALQHKMGTNAGLHADPSVNKLLDKVQLEVNKAAAEVKAAV